MKKLVLSILISFFVLVSPSQEIIKIMPSQPTASDTIELEIKTILPYGTPLDCPPFMGHSDSIFGDTLIYDIYYKVSGPLPQPGCTLVDTAKGRSALVPNNYTLIAFWHVIYDNTGGITLDTSARYASDTISFTVSNATGLEEFFTEQLKLHPNPVKEELNVSLNSHAKNMKISVLDINGKEHKIPLENQELHQWRLHTVYLPPGIYILQISSGKEIYSEKFVKL